MICNPEIIIISIGADFQFSGSDFLYRDGYFQCFVLEDLKIHIFRPDAFRTYGNAEIVE